MDGDSLALESIAPLSAQGIPVTRDAGWVYYTPPGSFSAADTFSFVVRDSRGAAGTGTVTIQPNTDTNTSPSLSVTDLGSGSFSVRFSAIPSLGYKVEAFANTQPPNWAQIGSATADLAGMVTFTDNPPGGTQRIYRLAPGSP